MKCQEPWSDHEIYRGYHGNYGWNFLHGVTKTTSRPGGLWRRIHRVPLRRRSPSNTPPWWRALLAEVAARRELRNRQPTVSMCSTRSTGIRWDPRKSKNCENDETIEKMIRHPLWRMAQMDHSYHLHVLSLRKKPSGYLKKPPLAIRQEKGCSSK